MFVSKIADCITDLIGNIILQPTLFDSKYLIESSRNMESDSIHLIILHILLDFFFGKPTFIRESKLQLVTIEHCFL